MTNSIAAPDAAHTQNGNDEDARLTRAEIAVLRRRLAQVETERDMAIALADGYRGQLASLTSSVSWRITRPYRTVRRMFRDRVPARTPGGAISNP